MGPGPIWFHPLAWWLDRTLAANAEHACDDAGVRAAGSAKEYASILLDHARSVRLNGGRMSYGMGIGGTGLVGSRVDRVLAGGSQPVSKVRTACVICICAACIVVAAACNRQLTPLKDDPQYKGANSRYNRDFEEARDMKSDQAAALEAHLDQNPEDLPARKKLLTFYTYSGYKTIGQKMSIVYRGKHILWTIEHHPDDFQGYRIYTKAGEAYPDPQGYAKAKKLWLEQLAKPDVSEQTLSNAARFLPENDPQIAEQALLRVVSMNRRHIAELGYFYGMSLGRDFSGPFAMGVRKKLDKSTDARLLAFTGEGLGRNLYHSPQEAEKQAYRVSLMERAQKLEPGFTRPDFYLSQFRSHELAFSLGVPQGYTVVSALPEKKRFVALAMLAEAAWTKGDMSDYYQHDTTGAKTQWSLGEKSARESLELAPNFPAEPSYGAALFRDHLVLGLAAMHRGEKKIAVDHLIAASKVPDTYQTRYFFGLLETKLPRWLLKDGERDAVLEYLDRFGRINEFSRESFQRSAKLIRQGIKPGWW